MSRELREAMELLVAIKTNGFIWFANYTTEQRVIAFKQITIIKNSKLVALLGCRICAVIGDGIVAADSDFYGLSDNTQMFILAHELGHIHCQHVTPKGYAYKRFWVALKGEVLSMEREADDFACQLCGGPECAYKALMELSNKLKGTPKKEAINRAIRYRVWL